MISGAGGESIKRLEAGRVMDGRMANKNRWELGWMVLGGVWKAT